MQLHEAFTHHAPSVIEGLRSKGFVVVDNFLPTGTILSMREEATAIYHSGRMQRAGFREVLEDGSTPYVTKSGIIYEHQGRISQGDEPLLFEYALNLKYCLPKL